MSLRVCGSFLWVSLQERERLRVQLLVWYSDIMKMGGAFARNTMTPKIRPTFSETANPLTCSLQCFAIVLQLSY